MEDELYKIIKAVLDDVSEETKEKAGGLPTNSSYILGRPLNLETKLLIRT